MSVCGWVQEVDVDFVRKSVSSIGQVAIRLEAAAQKCVEALLELVKLKVSYVVQEAVVVIKVCIGASCMQILCPVAGYG